MKERLGVGVAHSKIILMGEHAVVYGYPALALPLMDITVSCRVRLGLTKVDKTDDTLAYAIDLAKDYLGQENVQLVYELDSQVPEKRGMGSSAAVSLAGIRAVFDYFRAELSDDVLIDLANQAERVAHTNPSGLDVQTCMSDKTIKFIKNQGFEPVTFDLGAYLVIADTGIHGHTREAVQQIANLAEKKQSPLAKLGQLTLAAEVAIQDKELVQLGQAMTKAHEQLVKLGVSCQEADHLVKTALKKSALGAKMSGGGLGGCIIALVHSQEEAQQLSYDLEKEGAHQTWIRNL